MSSVRETRYQCSVCSRLRSYPVDIEEHSQKVKDSPNGLVIHSDIHRCDNGILGINNLHIDHDFAIRSFENLQLPIKRRPIKSSVPGIPLPAPLANITSDGNSMRTYPITKMIPDKDFRIRIIDERLRVIIKIGEINPKEEKMVAYITSDLGTIELEYYACSIRYNSNLEKWFSILTNLLEKLPPTTIGLFIETLMFIHSLELTPPSTFLITQLKTILTSHETHFQLKEKQENVTARLGYVAGKYGDEVAVVMNELISYLVANPLVPLRYFTRTHSEDL
ncbi:MAG: hypothetical protein ACXADH_13135, partial [Candidatus Kariarchaeaceae archaeon]